MNEEILYNKIQLLDNGVWVINDEGQIYAISLPLFVDYSRNKINSRKFVGFGIFIAFFIVVFSLIYLIFSVFSQILSGF